MNNDFEVNKDIRESRIKLREIYRKYKIELHEVVAKIDNMIERLETKENLNSVDKRLD